MKQIISVSLGLVFLCLFLVDVNGMTDKEKVDQQSEHTSTDKSAMRDWTITARNISGTRVKNFSFEGSLKEKLEQSELAQEQQVMLSFLQNGRPSKFQSVFVPLNKDFDEFFLPMLTVSNNLYPMQTYGIKDRVQFSLKARWPDYSKMRFFNIAGLCPGTALQVFSSCIS